MQQALKIVEEINRMSKAIEKTKSEYLKRDYGKAIKRKTAELRQYCRLNQLNYNAIINTKI